MLWQYLVDNCDSAAVWKVDLELAAYYVGGGVGFDCKEVLEAFGGRVVDVGRGRWWIPGFIPFQYGKLSEKCDFHKAVLKRLQSHGLMALWEAYLLDRDKTEPPETTPMIPPPTPPPPGGHKKEREEEDKEVLGKGSGENQDRPVEFPSGFPPTEEKAVEWAKVGLSRASADQVRLYWNEAAARNGTDVTRQPITRWVQHCNGRAIRKEGADAERKHVNGGSNAQQGVWTLQKQLDAVHLEIKKIQNRGHEDPVAGIVVRQEDRQAFRDLKKKRDELNAKIAKGGQ